MALREASAPRVANRGKLFRGQRTAYLYVLPALILVVGIIYAGIGYNGYISTTNWNGIGPDQSFIGFDNYVRVFGDPVFWTAVRNIAVFAAITIVVQMAIGLTMALLLSGNIKLGNVYKVVMFLPVVIAPAATSVAFRQLLTPDGQVNETLRFFGLDVLTHAWTSDPQVALLALAAINVWSWTGFSFILYQAALSQIDGDLIEAAQLDGASLWRTVRSIIIPQLSGTHATLVLIGIIGSLKTFDIVYLTTGGGPGGSTEFLTTYIYKQAINFFDAGYAAALSVVLLVLSVSLTLAQMRATKYGKD
ncbi:carbohydrate ABC transporter permease [Glaciibacter superstes]|uniref:carbohydrate ABC transporter permease n=1 Tax=Glaciibacter superstes TaxID=501023 RepID=UPI00041CF9A9|nr:sugar ABC transporter permease [Glaciibacter superstes]